MDNCFEKIVGTQNAFWTNYWFFPSREKHEKNYWQDLVNKHLVGKKIVKVEWLNPKETERIHGWDQQPWRSSTNRGWSCFNSIPR